MTTIAKKISQKKETEPNKEKKVKNESNNKKEDNTHLLFNIML